MKNKPRTSGADVITLLEDEHRVASEQLLSISRMPPGRDRDRLIAAVTTDLPIAMQVQEDVLYASLRAMGTVVSVAPFARSSLRDALRALELCRRDGNEVNAIAGTALHLHREDDDERRRNVFPIARRALSARALAAIGERVRAHRELLRKSGDQPGSPTERFFRRGPDSRSS